MYGLKYMCVCGYVPKITWDAGKVAWMDAWYFWGQLIRFDSSQLYFMLLLYVSVVIIVIYCVTTVVICTFICTYESIVLCNLLL